LAHAFGEENGLTESYLCPGVASASSAMGTCPRPTLSKDDKTITSTTPDSGTCAPPPFPRYDNDRPSGHDWGHFARRNPNLPVRAGAHRVQEV
jgi:hypothetical protein